MKTKMVFMFTDRFRPFSPLVRGHLPSLGCCLGKSSTTHLGPLTARYLNKEIMHSTHLDSGKETVHQTCTIK
jgi:hypothetical protein